ncbi:GNAT family N-acetyltransferase [uncultured Sphingomonas sp.]|jgi:RimJ/RimL family protein N-acetyltransferase|uniref:GNAT family N-acetyltransferase n=2 Tax=Sphingomonadaceae TaxID=41297 RepID=UPI0030D9768E
MIGTRRLILRPWRRSDVASLYAMGQDAEVMRYLGPPDSMADCRRLKDRMTESQARHGHCFWALERRSDRAFIGFCGLKRGRKGTPIAGELEISWRLARDAWGQGLALEAARASLSWGWRNLDAPAATAVTVPANWRSRGLMERLGMLRDPGGDFDHPDMARGDPLRHHIRYRIARPVKPPLMS